MSLPPFGIPYTPFTTVDLGCLTGTPEGITLFTMVGSRRETSGMSQQEAFIVPTIEGERGSPAVDPLVWRMTNLTISDRPGTPTPEQIHHHQH
jgi:hypothetical protein